MGCSIPTYNLPQPGLGRVYRPAPVRTDRNLPIMRKLVLSFLMLLAAGFTASAPAQEAPVPTADARAIEAVIRAQLDAFARDDARKAFSYAAPGIRQAFGTPENFLVMVRSGYPVVYRPASVHFLKPVADEGAVIQPVRMTDADGTAWIALYLMQRQPDGVWLTNGCRLARSEGQVT
jgi:Domain of unknown function (DUF4864)